MREDTPHRKNVYPVDLKLAQAYVPICVSFIMLCLIQSFTCVTYSESMRSWVIVLFMLQFSKLFTRPSIFNSHAMFVTIANSGVLLAYQRIHTPPHDFQNTLPFLWVCQFLISNISLVQPLGMQKHASVTKILSLLLCVCLLVSGLFVKAKVEPMVFEFIRPFLFYFSCIMWLYGTESHMLRHDQAYELHECALRFNSVLVTPISVSGFLTFLICVVCIVHIIKNNSDFENQEGGKKFDFITPVTKENMSRDEEKEMFRMAKSNQEQA